MKSLKSQLTSISGAASTVSQGLDRMREGIIGQVIAAEALSWPEVKRLMTVPEVNVIVAATFMAAVGDIRRFEDRRKLTKIFGRYTDSDIRGRAHVLRLLKLALASAQHPIREIHFKGSIGVSYVTASSAVMKDLRDDFLGLKATSGPRGKLKREGKRKRQKEPVTGLENAEVAGKDQALQVVNQGYGEQVLNQQFIEENVKRLGSGERGYQNAMRLLRQSGQYAVPLMVRYLRDPAKAELHRPIRNALVDLGRVSLNPVVHFDPVGALMFFLIALGFPGIAWGRPVPVNDFRLRPAGRFGRQGSMALVSFAGPLSNVVLGAIAAGILRLSSATGINDDQGFLATDVGRQIRLLGSDGKWRWAKIAARTSSTSRRS